MFIAIVLASGTYVFLSYPSREDPSITIREAVITAASPGLSPQRVEELVSKPIEEAVREMPEVKEIRSDSKTGVSIVRLTVHDRYSSLQPIWQKLRDKMDDLAPSLPAGTQGPFVEDEVGLTAVATVAL